YRVGRDDRLHAENLPYRPGVDDQGSRIDLGQAQVGSQDGAQDQAPLAAPTKPPVAPPALLPPDPYDPDSRPPSPPAKVDVDVAEKFSQLQQQLLAMQTRLLALERARGIHSSDNRAGTDPTFRVFVAKKGATDSQFQEQVLDGGNFVDADPDKSRHCTSDDDPSAVITPGDDKMVLLEMEDSSDSGKVKRFLKLLASNSV